MPVTEELGALTRSAPVRTPLDGNAPCYRTYACADGGHFAVAAVEGKFWSNVTRALGHPEWQTRQFDPTLIPDVAAVFAERTRDQWAAALDAADTCATPVRTSGELLTDPHIAERGSLIRHPHPDGDLWQVAPPFVIADRTPNEENAHA